MSGSPDIRPSSVSTAGYADGLGRRSVRFNREVGGMLECLHLRPQFLAFEPALRAAAAELASLDDERFARVRDIERDGASLTVVSELVTGHRLIDILETREAEDSAVSGIDAAFGFLLQAMPALAELHARTITHGALAPGRIIITPTSQVVLLDSIYGAALERLKLNRRTLWTSFGILAPPTVAPPPLDACMDVAQVALCALLLAAGRPPDSTANVSALAPLVREVAELAEIRTGGPFAEAVGRFFTATLPAERRRPAVTSEEAAAEIRRLVDYISEDECLNALAELVSFLPVVIPEIPVAGTRPEPEAIEVVQEAPVPPSPRESAASARPAPLSPLQVVAPAWQAVPVDRAAEPSADPLTDLISPPHVAASAPQPPPSPRESAASARQALPAPLVTTHMADLLDDFFGGSNAEPAPLVTTAPISEGPPMPPLHLVTPPPTPVVAAPPLAPPTPVFAAPPIPAPAPPPAPVLAVPVWPPAPMPFQDAPVVFTPPAAVPLQVMPAAAPPLVRIRQQGPAGYAPPRPRRADVLTPPVPPPAVPVLARAVQRAAVPWKAIAAAAVVLVGILAGRSYLQDRPESPIVAAGPVGAPAKAPAAPIAAPTTGSLVVNSQPEGATVILDSEVVGVTPLVLDAVSVGKHKVEITDGKVTVQRTVLIEAGKPGTLSVPVFSGWLAVFAPIRLDVSEGRRTLGSTDSGRIVLAPGRHVLTLSNRELGYTASQTVEIQPGEERVLNVKPMGLVNLNASPWAEVWVDGTRAGETPLANLQVPLGTREFLFKHPQYGERRLTATITTTASALTVDFGRPPSQP
jgi:serine/threonine protein kinase